MILKSTQEKLSSWSFYSWFLCYQILHFITMCVCGGGGSITIQCFQAITSRLWRAQCQNKQDANSVLWWYHYACQGRMRRNDVSSKFWRLWWHCHHEIASKWITQSMKKETCPKRWWNHSWLWNVQYCWPQTVPSKSSRTLESELCWWFEWPLRAACTIFLLNTVLRTKTKIPNFLLVYLQKNTLFRR